MSPDNSRLIKKIVPHILIWLFGGMLYLLVEKGLLGDSTTYPSTGNFYSFEASIVAVLGLSLVMGVTIGILEEYLFKRLMRKQPFIPKLIFKTVLYVTIIVVTMISSAFLMNGFLMQLPPNDPRVLEEVTNFTNNFAFISINLYISTIIALGLFFSEMIDHIGVNAVVNFFTGRYSTSRVEDRVFMFLDMRSSTTIAEQLGHEKYYRLLNRYYVDMTDAIIQTAGEIYQYVGDEIVVSWKLKSGIQDANCIKCFFLIKDQVEKKKASYVRQFGLVPEFKAGFHYGNVTTGEVGLIKKEILFTGDVLNTTSRIQELCNSQQTDILLSAELLEALRLNGEYKKTSKGSFELRGRDQRVELYTLHLNQS